MFSAYTVQRRAVLGDLDDLDGGVVADVDRDVWWDGDLREAETTRVVQIRGTSDLEDRNHVVGHVERLGAQSQIDVEEGELMTVEPTWLDGNGASAYGPLGSVARSGHTAA